MVNRSFGLFLSNYSAVNILEIRISAEIWQRIAKVAESKRKSYSWVVRYCIFRLIRHHSRSYITGNIVWRGKRYHRWVFCDLMNERALRQKQAAILHRHRLCLYGEDELYIRMTAGVLKITMTHLARLALEWHLSSLERGIGSSFSRFRERAFYWLGIKLFRDVEFPTRSSDYLHIRFRRMPDHEYW